jgi:opacity protein-like surface antigen
MVKQLFVCVLIVSVVGVSKSDDRWLSVSLKGTYTTSTLFIYNFNNPVAFEPERVLSSNFGYGADVRANVLWDRFYIGISIERIRSNGSSFSGLGNSPYVIIPVTEGFDMTLAEVSGYYIVPVSTDEIQFYMGGGFGYYNGQRHSSFAGIVPIVLKTESNVGIHVLTGVEYALTKNLGLRGELKFRDPHFDVTDKYKQGSVYYKGYYIRLRQTESVTRVNLNGINYMLGVVFKF